MENIPWLLFLKEDSCLKVKFADSGKTIDPAKIKLEGVDKNQVGVYNAIITIGNVRLNKKVVIYDPSIVGKDITGSYYDIDPRHTDMQENTPRRGKIYLVEGTKNIFFATDLGFKEDFPVYFQMNGETISVIPQPYVYNDIVLVKLDWNPENRQMDVFIRITRHEREHPDDPTYGYYYTFQMN